MPAALEQAPEPGVVLSSEQAQGLAQKQGPARFAVLAPGPAQRLLQAAAEQAAEPAPRLVPWPPEVQAVGLVPALGLARVLGS